MYMFILVEIGCIDYRMKSLRGILPETLYKSSLWIVLALKLIQILTNDKSNHINTNPVLLVLFYYRRKVCWRLETETDMKELYE